MDAKTTGIVAYLTWIGLLIAYLAGDKEGAKFHINQSLVLFLFGLLGCIPFIGWIWEVVIFVFWIIAFVGAIQGQEKSVPLLGGIKIIK